MSSSQLPHEEEGTLDNPQRKDSGGSQLGHWIKDWIHVPELKQQARQLFPLVFACLLGVAVVVFLAYLISVNTGHSPDYLTKDPAAITGSELYMGMLSTAGVMLWGGMTAAALAGAVLPAGRLPTRFFLAMAALFLILGLDDAYQLHEDFFPNYLGLPESIVHLAYVALVPGWLLLNQKAIRKTGFLLLLTALGFLGLSLALDYLVPYGRRQTFIEDSFKLAGIVLLLAYTLHTVRLSAKPEA